MDRKAKRLLLLVVSCSVTGVIFGGTSSWAKSSRCLDAATVTSECLTQEPNGTKLRRNPDSTHLEPVEDPLSWADQKLDWTSDN